MKYILTLGLLLSCCAADAQKSQTGIRFFKGSWKKALAEARNTGKLIFVDVYTDWCVPCKKMAEEIFPLPEVGEKFNTHFINLQLDAEGNGRAVASEFKVRSYPTYLWVNGEGEVVYRAAGYNSDHKRFLGFADAAMRGGETPAKLQKLHQEKKTDKAFLRQYIVRMHNFEMKSEVAGALDQYFSLLTPAELVQHEHASFLLKYANDVQSRTFNYILDHQSFFASDAVLTDNIEPDIVRRTNAAKLGVMLSNAVVELMMELLSKKNDTVFEYAVAQAGRVQNLSVLAPVVISAFKLNYWHTSKNTKRFVEEGVPYIDSLAHLPGEAVAQLDEQRFQELFNGKDSVNRHSCSRQIAMILSANSKFYGAMFTPENPEFDKVLFWAQKSTQYSPERSDFYEHLCNLYIKASKNEEAKAAIQAAIDLAIKYKKEDLVNTYRIKLESIP